METLVLLIFIVILIAVGLAGGLLYLLYVPIKKRLLKNGNLTLDRSRQINKAYIFVLVLFSIYQTFVAFVPNTSFYEKEFKTVTLRDIPKSAKFIEKTASYPDFHGDYCSSYQIKLSKADYDNLLAELNLDNKITKSGTLKSSDEFLEALGGKKSKSIIHNFTRQIKGEEDHYLYIGFYDDNETIFVNICVT